MLHTSTSLERLLITSTVIDNPVTCHYVKPFHGPVCLCLRGVRVSPAGASVHTAIPAGRMLRHLLNLNPRFLNPHLPYSNCFACYPPANPSGNCSEVIQNWTDGNWRSSIPGSMHAPNFESFVFKKVLAISIHLLVSLASKEMYQ